MTVVECVAFLLIDGNRVLAERRKLTAKADPGITAIPGGHLETGESLEQALYREAAEELGIVPGDVKYICTLLHRSQELLQIHFFAVETWTGEIQNNEAEALLWIPVDELERFDADVDRVAVCEHLRIHRDQPGALPLRRGPTCLDTRREPTTRT
jgi:mutator protein MutT